MLVIDDKLENASRAACINADIEGVPIVRTAVNSVFYPVTGFKYGCGVFGYSAECVCEFCGSYGAFLSP